MTTTNDVINKLNQKNLEHDQELEFIVLKPSGELVTANVSEKTAKQMIAFLKKPG